MSNLKQRLPFGSTDLTVPPIIFGTSAFGNLYLELPYEKKRRIAERWFECIEGPVVIDTAGKYGAGMALEMVGRTLNDLGVAPERVIISNKLGWKRVPLTGPEPTFELGVWKGIGHDAVQAISYFGILECWQQGCELLGGDYVPQLVSIHDPDEYLDGADSDSDREKRVADLLEAYRALDELKKKGLVQAVGVGAKTWQVIRELSRFVRFDWVMFAGSYTLHTHPRQLLEYMKELARQGVAIINAAVFNAGFLTGGAYFNYRKPDDIRDPDLFLWRSRFFRICDRHRIKPADACVEFGLSPPEVLCVALNTSKAERVAENVRAVLTKAPKAFWRDMKKEGLLNPSYSYLG